MKNIVKIGLFFILSQVFAKNISYQGVQIVIDLKEESTVLNIYSSVYQVSVVKLKHEHESVMLHVIERAFAKYPKGFLAKYLKKVYLVDSVCYFGESVAGLSNPSDSTIFLHYCACKHKIDTFFMEQTFHHEFSHLLYYGFGWKFKALKWYDANPSDFDYNKLWNKIRAKKRVSPSPRLNSYDIEYFKEGFINLYATKSLKEDFATVAEHLFLSDIPDFWKTISNNRRLKKKVNIIIEFYRKLDPSFTREYFSTLPKG